MISSLFSNTDLPESENVIRINWMIFSMAFVSLTPVKWIEPFFVCSNQLIPNIKFKQTVELWNIPFMARASK